MAESWRQRQVDIEHWLQTIRPPSPEPFKESDRELTSSSDTTTTEQASSLPPVTRPISSHPLTNLADNAALLHSPPHPKPSPVTESAVCANIQSFSSALQLYFPPKMVQTQAKEFPSSQSKGELKRKTRSPLPLSTPEPKLPTFTTFDEDADSTKDLNQQAVNLIVNRPPTRPLRSFSRASTSPALSDSSQSPPTSRKVGLRQSSVQTLNVDSDLLKSHRKSMSQGDVSHLVGRERRPSRERCSSDSELKQNDSQEHLTTLNGGSQSSTGACGLGSDPSDTSSTHGEVIAEDSPTAMKRRMFKGFMSVGSIEVLTTRLREIGAQNQDDEDVSLVPPTHLLSPTSPTLSRHSRPSRSPSPTPPTSPYHTPIVPLSVRSETSHPRPPRPTGGKGETVFSKSRLKQFDMSQQYSFDTTNDDLDFSTPSRHPKFLKNNVSMLAKSRTVPHSRSHSDVSSIPSLSHSSVRSTSDSPGSKGLLPTGQSPENKDISMRQYKSQFELSTVRTNSEQEGGKPLTLFEQLQLRRQQTAGGKTSWDSTKNRLFRQDSGLGTLSTISQRF